jgi:methionyl-tRNA synthetase
LSPAEEALRAHAALLVERVAAAVAALALHEVVAAIGAFVGQANQYIEATAPWVLARRGDCDRLALVLDHVVEAARLAAWYYSPIIPRAAADAHRRLAGTPPSRGQGIFGAVPRGEVVVGPPLFPRLVLAAVPAVVH